MAQEGTNYTRSVEGQGQSLQSVAPQRALLLSLPMRAQTGHRLKRREAGAKQFMGLNFPSLPALVYASTFGLTLTSPVRTWTLYAATLRSSSTNRTPGADHAARSASLRSAHE
jgi:hypothetical protein